MSLLRGVQRLALGLVVGVVVVAAAAAGGLLPVPPYRLAALWSRSSGILGIDDKICGGINDAPGREMDRDAIELARFAVSEHNSKTNAVLEFVRLVKVRYQLVAGDLYYFTVEVREVAGGANKLYEAKVWLRPWENIKGLHTFEPVADAWNADEGKRGKPMT